MAYSDRAAVGRDVELAVVGDFLDAQSPSARALVVEGDAGIGKTTVVRAALELAQLSVLRVLAARPSSGETELPYAALGDLLAPIGDESLDRLAATQRETIEVALGRASGTVNEHTLSRGLLELLRRECADHEVLLLVDDAQWLDRPTASALAFALRRLDSQPLRVLIAVRNATGANEEPPLGVGEWRDVRRLVVGPMSATEVGRLLRERLGLRLPRPQVEELTERSAGNPLFALELAGQGPARQAEGATLAAVIANRLRTVDPGARTALAYAAAALRPSVDLLLEAGVSRAELHAALESGALEIDANRLSFTHPLFRAAAEELLLPDERREIHARLAAASADIVERGHHLSRSVASHDDDAAAAVEHAAVEAANLGDHAGAAAFLLRAAELSSDAAVGQADDRELRAATEFYLAGDVDAASALSGKLVERLPAGVHRARARLAHVVASVGPGAAMDDGLVELAAALEDAAGDPGLQAELHVEMSEIACCMCRLEDAVAHARTAARLAESVGDSATAVAALTLQGFAESMRGYGVPRAAREAFEKWDGAVGMMTSPRMDLACACMHATQFDDAAELFTQELATAQELGLEPIEVVARGHLAEVQMRAGNWADAFRNAGLSFDHARQAADPQIIAATSCIMAMADALLGNHERARALAREALPTAEELHDFWWTIGARAVLGLVAHAEGEPREAVDVLSPAWDLMIDRELGDLSIFPVAHVLGESLVAVGCLDDADELVERLRGCPVGQQPWCTAMASRVAALVASAHGEHTAARAAIAAALDAHSELPEPFEHARTLHIHGRIERNARNWGAARAALVDALQRFDLLGAAHWSEQVAADLARLPGRRPVDSAALTTREREIAELAASGLTNKDVAGRLFLSVRTIEANLSKVYAKLGVRSRTELANRLSDAAPSRVAASHLNAAHGLASRSEHRFEAPQEDA
jgi:DNA-binding NarL/FixJ family response regulator